MSADAAAINITTGGAVTASLAAVEVATGINVPLFVWGLAGGLWAFRFLAPMPAMRRLASLAIAGLLAGVLARPLALVVIAAASHYFAWWPREVSAQLVAAPIALSLGLLCHTVIGRKLIEIASRTADGVSK